MKDAHDPLTPDLFSQEEPRWLQLLREAVRTTGQGKRGGVLKTAEQLLRPDGGHYSRVYISLFLNALNTQPASAAFQKSVMAAFGDGRIDCPHLGLNIAPNVCQAHAKRSFGATNGPDEVAHWKACRSCPLNPVNPVIPVKPVKPAPTKAQA